MLIFQHFPEVLENHQEIDHVSEYATDILSIVLITLLGVPRCY